MNRDTLMDRFFWKAKFWAVCDVIICDLRRWVPCFRSMSFCGASQMQGRWSKMFLFQSITPRPAHAAFCFLDCCQQHDRSFDSCG